MRHTKIFVLFFFSVCLARVDSRAGVIAFSSDFETGTPAQVGGTGVLTGTQGYGALGFGNTFLRTQAGNGVANGISVTLTNLPSHSSVDIDFLLAVIDSWDGVGNPTHGPDGLTVAIDGVPIFAEVFENSFSGVQTYTPPIGVELARHADLGFTPVGSFFRDSAYDMGLDTTFDNIAHTASTLTISWYRHSGRQINGSSSVPVDESWAIDNVSVRLNAMNSVPEPSTLMIACCCGILGLGCRRRRC